MNKVTVRVPERLNLEQSQKILATVLGKSGCPNCYSGLNISFENLVDPAERLMVVEGLEKVIEIGGREHEAFGR